MGHRDCWRGDDLPDQEEHDHPDQAADLHHLLRQPARGDDPGVRGREGHDQGQPPPGQVRPDRHPTSAKWRPSDRGHLRYRRQWYPQRICFGQVHREAEQDHDHQRQGQVVQGGHREDGQRCREFKAEDEVQKERIAAKNGLESYCFNMKATIDDEKVKDKISEATRRPSMTSATRRSSGWTGTSWARRRSSWTSRRRWAVCSPIVTKLYQGAGGAPGGMPGAGSGASGKGDG